MRSPAPPSREAGTGQPQSRIAPGGRGGAREDPAMRLGARAPCLAGRTTPLLGHSHVVDRGGARLSARRRPHVHLQQEEGLGTEEWDEPMRGGLHARGAVEDDLGRLVVGVLGEHHQLLQLL